MPQLDINKPARPWMEGPYGLCDDSSGITITDAANHPLAGIVTAGPREKLLGSAQVMALAPELYEALAEMRETARKYTAALDAMHAAEDADDDEQDAREQRLDFWRDEYRQACEQADTLLKQALERND